MKFKLILGKFDVKGGVKSDYDTLSDAVNSALVAFEDSSVRSVTVANVNGTALFYQNKIKTGNWIPNPLG